MEEVLSEFTAKSNSYNVQTSCGDWPSLLSEGYWAFLHDEGKVAELGVLPTPGM